MFTSQDPFQVGKNPPQQLFSEARKVINGPFTYRLETVRRRWEVSGPRVVVNSSYSSVKQQQPTTRTRARATNNQQQEKQHNNQNNNRYSNNGVWEFRWAWKVHTLFKHGAWVTSRNCHIWWAFFSKESTEALMVNGCWRYIRAFSWTPNGLFFEFCFAVIHRPCSYETECNSCGTWAGRRENSATEWVLWYLGLFGFNWRWNLGVKLSWKKYILDLFTEIHTFWCVKIGWVGTRLQPCTTVAAADGCCTAQ